MKIKPDKNAFTLSTSVTGFAATMCLSWWISYDPVYDFVPNIPGMDNKPSASELAKAKKANSEVVNIGEFTESFDGTPSDLPGDWPRLRGSEFDNINTDKIPLAESWPEEGPPQLWSIELGEGHAAPAVKNGRIYLLDYIEDKKEDALRCFSLADGKEIWRRSYRVHVKRNHGFSRTIPAVTDSFVVSIGPRCHVMCVNAVTGEYLWGIDLEKDYDTETPFWYTGQCALIDDGVAVIAPGGKALMIGVDCATGEKLWETPNPKGWQMSHSSIILATIKGKRTYVYCSSGGLIGVSAEEGEKGKLLWQNASWSPSVSAPSPVVLEDGRIFATGGYGAGSILLQVIEKNGTFSTEKILKFKPDEGMSSEQQTPIFYKNHFFNIQPKDAGVLRKQLVCYPSDDITKPAWTSGNTVRFGLGPFMIADDKIFVLNDDGLLKMLDASTRGYKELASAQVLNGHDAWGPMALAAGRLLVRDSRKMVCLDVRKK